VSTDADRDQQAVIQRELARLRAVGYQPAPGKRPADWTSVAIRQRRQRHRISLSLTPEQKRLFVDCAARERLTLSEWLRRVAIRSAGSVERRTLDP
jgi:hypothetical protein